MSIFSKMKGAKKAAEAHKKKLEEEAKNAHKPIKEPYRHVPTHAAADAVTGSPSWREADRASIIYQNNKRKSAMSSPTSRSSSSSNVHRISEYSSGQSSLQHSSRSSSRLSQSSMLRSSENLQRTSLNEVMHSSTPVRRQKPYFSHNNSTGVYHNSWTPGKSPLSIHESPDESPAESSSGSTSSRESEQRLEMRMPAPVRTWQGEQASAAPALSGSRERSPPPLRMRHSVQALSPTAADMAPDQARIHVRRESLPPLPSDASQAIESQKKKWFRRSTKGGAAGTTPNAH